MAGVCEALGAQSPPGSTPNWLESLFLHLEVVPGELSQTLRACPMARVWGAMSGRFGGAACGGTDNPTAVTAAAV